MTLASVDSGAAQVSLVKQKVSFECLTNGIVRKALHATDGTRREMAPVARGRCAIRGESVPQTQRILATE